MVFRWLRGYISILFNTLHRSLVLQNINFFSSNKKEKASLLVDDDASSRVPQETAYFFFLVRRLVSSPSAFQRLMGGVAGLE